MVTLVRQGAELLEHIESRCIRSKGNCLVWQGAESPSGYGILRIGIRPGKVVRVHRIAYILRHGELTAEQLVCHTCDVKLCVEDSHHFVGSQQDNVRDMDSKSRRKVLVGQFASQAKITDAVVDKIRIASRSGEMGKDLALRYGISRGQVSYIINNKSRVHGRS